MDEIWGWVVLALLIAVATQVYNKYLSRDGEATIIAEDDDLQEQPVDPVLLSGPSSKRPRSGKAILTLVWLILTQGAAVLLLAVWFLTLIAAQAVQQPWELLLAGALLLHPVTALVCSGIAWLLYTKARYTTAAIVTSLPLVPYAVLFLLWVNNGL